MPLFNRDNGVDAVNALGQVGPAVAQGQYRGMELGEQRRRDQAQFLIQQMTQQRMLEELKQRMAQAHIENQFREQQMSNQQQQFGETQRFHQQTSEDRRKHDVQQMNEFAIKMHQGQMKADSARNKWKVSPQGFLYNETTGETKMPNFGQTNGTPGGTMGVHNEQANAAELGHILQAIPNVQAMGTNAPPTVMPALTNMLGQVQGRVMGQGMPQQPPQPPGMPGLGQVPPSPQGPPGMPQPSATNRFKILQVQ